MTDREPPLKSYLPLLDELDATYEEKMEILKASHVFIHGIIDAIFAEAEQADKATKYEPEK